HLFRTQSVAVVRAIEQDFSANADAGNISHIHLHLVHADAANDWRAPAFHQYFSNAGETPRQAIVIAKGNNADLGCALRHKCAVIAQRFSRSKLLDAGNAAGNSNSQFQVHDLLRGLGRINSVKPQANAHHVVTSFRKTDRACSVGSMNLKTSKPIRFQRCDDLVESRDLLAREIVRVWIFRGSKMRADSGEPHDAARSNTLRHFQSAAWRHSQAMHPGIDLQMHVKNAVASG